MSWLLFCRFLHFCFRDLEPYPSVVCLHDANHQRTTFPMWLVTKDVILKPCQCQLSTDICFFPSKYFFKIYLLINNCMHSTYAYIFSSHDMCSNISSILKHWHPEVFSTPSLSTQLQPQTTPTTTITTNMSSIFYSIILTVDFSLPQHTPPYHHKSLSPLSMSA